MDISIIKKNKIDRSLTKFYHILFFTNGMLAYSFHVYACPVNLLNDFNKCIRNFVSSGDISYTKVCNVTWKTLCKSTDEGGLAIRSATKTIPPSRYFILWRFSYDKLPTDDNRRKIGCCLVSVC